VKPWNHCICDFHNKLKIGTKHPIFFVIFVLNVHVGAFISKYIGGLRPQKQWRAFKGPNVV